MKWMQVVVAAAIALVVAAAIWLVTILTDEQAPSRARGPAAQPTILLTRVEKVQVPTEGRLAAWETELVNQEKSLRDREAQVEEWIEHLKGREKAILAAEEGCEL